MYINFLLFRVAICLLLLNPLKAFAGDCLVGILKVKKNLKIDRQYQNQKINMTGKISHNVDAKGQVMFGIKEGKLDIISKSISGYSSSKWFGETPCVRHEGDAKGILIEGNMSQKKGGSYTAYWKTDHNGHSTIKGGEGCMQDPIPPIKYTEEEEDYAFEGIVRPGMYKLSSLCSNVKSNPTLGYCNETSQGFYGMMILRPLSLEVSPGVEGGGTGPSVEGNEVYEWYVRKVPCECSARIVGVTGDVKINEYPISGKTDINLSDAIVETGRKSSVTINFGNATIKVGPNSSINLTDVCQKKEKPSVLEVIKGSIRAIIQRAVTLGQGPKEFIYKGSNAVIGVRGTDFIFISGDDKAVVMVLDGEVSFWDINKRKTVTVEKNQKSECEKGGIPTNPVFFNPQEIPEWSL